LAFVMALQTEPGSADTDSIFAGVDVGGTQIKLGLVDGTGRVLAQDKWDTRQAGSPADAMRRCRQSLDTLLAKIGRPFREVLAVGLGVPGPMDLKQGMLLNPGNLPLWHYAPVQELLREACGGLSVTMTNDANAAAFGEFWVGAGRNAKSLVLVTLGTGVGGGIVVDGRCWEGEHGAAAEIGHVCIDRRPDARMCACGRRGHLEAYASATALVQRIREMLAEGAPSTLERTDGQGQAMTGLTVFQHAQSGDPLAQRVIMETADYLAWGLADIAHIVDPELYVLGGGMSFGGAKSLVGRAFLDRVEQSLRRLVFPVISAQLQMVYSQLGNDAGFVGAAGLARQRASQPT
jgi:glucokinase